MSGVKNYSITLLLLGACSAGFAAPSVGSIMSTGSFQLGGAAISANGVTSWPLFDGDQIQTDVAPALIILRDQTRLSVAPHSNVQIGQSGNQVVLRLNAGDVAFSEADSSRVSLIRVGGVARFLAPPRRHRGPQPVPTPSAIKPTPIN